jgi:hypothetical protein
MGMGRGSFAESQRVSKFSLLLDFFKTLMNCSILTRIPTAGSVYDFRNFEQV